MSRNEIPSAFVFTKMQTDAGEDIDAIRNRKELERVAGKDIFWWGIGESKWQAIGALRQIETRPQVLFSLMLSRPSLRSREPGEVYLWKKFRTPQGEQALPRHVVVISGATKNGAPKSRYHALVCKSRSSILRNGGGIIDVKRLINIGDGGRPVGPSQVTASVRYVQAAATGHRSYEIAARAELTQPFFVNLASPRKLSAQEQRLLREVGHHGKTAGDWLEVAERLRNF